MASLESIITNFLSDHGLEKSLEKDVQKLVNKCFESVFKVIYDYKIPETKENDNKVLEIQLVLAKMDAYKLAISDYNLYSDFETDFEMKVLRNFCNSQEQFLDVLKVYDDGRFIYKDGQIIDKENPPSDYESESE